MGWRAWTVIAGLQAAALMVAAPAAAEFRVCNKAGESVDVAFGYDGGGKTGWVAEGWWTIQPGRCVTIFGRVLTGRYYYLYAEAASGDEWNGDETEGAEFCINRKVFRIFQRHHGDNTEEDCERAKLESKRFFEVDVGDYERWIQTLDGAPNESAPPPRPQPPPSTSSAPSEPPARGSACERFPNLC